MLIELLRSAARQVPDQPLVITNGTTVTYAECLERCETLARGLHARGIDRFACLTDNVADTIAVLCAASAAGSEACTYPATWDDAHVVEYASSVGHAVAVSDRPRALHPLDVVDVDTLASADGDIPPQPDQTTVLILTTGTTGVPKASVHDWERLARSVRHPDPAPGARWLLAYNLNQFAGIQVLLHVLISRATLVAPPSRRPQDVVESMRAAAVTRASATPTFWRLLCGVLDDVTARALPLEQITMGGEPAPAALLDNLRRLFPAARITHVYAGTEFGSSVSVSDGRNGLPLSVLDRGPDADVQLRVVDGELEIRSRVGMLGYLGEAALSGAWLPTGDLVEVGDDRIQFVGRRTDEINVGGVKVHPLPVEDLLAGVPGVQLARVYGRLNPVTGQVVAADIVAAPGVETAALDREIRAACAALPAASRPRLVRFVDELEVREHKVSRPQVVQP